MMDKLSTLHIVHLTEEASLFSASTHVMQMKDCVGVCIMS